eukprot:c28683_g2_i2 orf=478-3453(+)
MKNILRKLHIGGSQDNFGSRTHEVGGRVLDGRTHGIEVEASGDTSVHSETPSPSAACVTDQRVSSGISGWLNNARHGRHSLLPSNAAQSSSRSRLDIPRGGAGGSEVSRLENNRERIEDSQIGFQDYEEEYQVQLALALSVSSNDVRDDPDSVQIRAAKRISLGRPPSPGNTLAEFISHRYWMYNVLDYDEKVVNGFYDVYGVVSDFGAMPSLVDLQGTAVTDNLCYEVVLVNRAIDPDLTQLEQAALYLSLECGTDEVSLPQTGLIQRIANLVSEHMGGPVSDANEMLKRWRTRSYELRTSLNNIVLPLGCLRIGLSRHRALVFKVLADYVGIPCRLVKGSHYTGTDEGAVNIVKIDNEREYIVDLMGAPGTLLPAEIVGMTPQMDQVESVCIGDNSTVLIGIKEPDSHSSNLVYKHANKDGELEWRLTPHESSRRTPNTIEDKDCLKCLSDGNVGGRVQGEQAIRGGLDVVSDQPAEGEWWLVSPQQQRTQAIEGNKLAVGEGVKVCKPGICSQGSVDLIHVDCYQPMDNTLSCLNPFGGMEGCYSEPFPMVASAAPDTSMLSVVKESFCREMLNGVPASVDATTTGAVLLSTITVEAEGSNTVQETTLTNTITATDSALVATSAADRGFLEENGLSGQSSTIQKVADADYRFCESGSGDKRYPINASQHGHKDFKHSANKEMGLENQNIFERSSEHPNTKADPVLDDVAEWEIPWEEIVLAERIGLGSYGEVYHGDWNGTEVAVKKFLDQDFSGDALDEFISEIRLMCRMRHPNVVLFIGAVTRPPNLSIVTEYLPRGSLFRLLHRPNTQLNEELRLKMALDVAKGMNYLHTSTPIIVHRDLKSPNLLVDKNWVVKVCDFGLSRMKHHTFLSSKSTAGTPEWMAPEVLRNEPSNEKCDVYSFGVILWELATSQQPWSGINPMQVVGAVGFQNRRLEIPRDVDPLVARIIRECWQSDPSLRPSFSQLMVALKPLQRLIKPFDQDYPQVH